MKYQQLGSTGVFVSRLCLGAMTFGGGSGSLYEVIGALKQPEADSLVGASLDAGVNFFDTANVYGEGESEVMLGRALGNRRKDAVIGTKVYSRMGPGVNQVGSSRLNIIQQAEESLKRLNTDYIDLYQLHGFDWITPLEETMKALDHLVRQGKVRYIGCSNFAAWHVMKAQSISTQYGLERFVTLQAYYSLVGRELEREIIPMLNDQKIGLLPWSPLAGGLLSGKFSRNNTGDQNARRTKFDFPPVDLEKAYAVIDVLQEIAKRLNTPVAQVAIAWLLHQPSVTSVIIGAKTLAQLKDNLGAVDVTLSPEDLKNIDSISGLTPEYPQWMFSLQSSDREPGTTRDWSKMTRST
jgi:aryl-alcohol dehydrogenase-like predicted oxidoreductase